MSGSRADLRRLPAILLTLHLACLPALLAAGATALAEEAPVGPPLRLLPGSAGTAGTAPATVPAGAQTPGPTPGQAPSQSPAPQRTASVGATPLGAPDLDGAGPLTAAQGGLPASLWDGTPRAVALPLLEALPVGSTSPAAIELARRLLLSDAVAPITAPGEPPPARRLGALRVEKAAALGDARGARDLAARLPGVLDDAGAARALAEAELAVGGLDCTAASDRGEALSGPWWRALDVFCQARGGDRTGARAGLAALATAGGGDPAFRAAIGAMIGGSGGAVRALPDPSVLTLAALRLAGMAPPAEALRTAGPWGQVLIARNGSVDPATRVAAGERAAAYLRLDTRELTELYRAVPARGEELLRIGDAAGRERSARNRALAYQAMSGTVDGRRRAELAAAAAGLVEPAGRAGPMGAVALLLLDTVVPGPEAATLAGPAVTLYMAQGRAEPARRWYALLETQAPDRAARLWPLAAVALGSGPARDLPPGFSTWLEAALRGADPVARGQATAQLTLLAGLGYAVPAEAWGRAAGREGPPPAGGEPVVLARLGPAAAAGRIGETVLLALTLLGDAGPAGAPPATVAAAAGALATVGLHREARALVREALAAMAE